MTQKYALINETKISKKHGGAVMTLTALIEPRKAQIEYLCTADNGLDKLDDMDLDEYIFILGNVHGNLQNTLPKFRELLTTQRFVCVQFDYVWCGFRSEIAHNMMKGDRCMCPIEGSPYKALWELQAENTRHMFFMSDEQRQIFHTHTGAMTNLPSSVLSSAFSVEHLDMLNYLRLTTTKIDKFAVIDGGMDEYGSYCKGIDVSIKFAQMKNIPYEVLMQRDYKELMTELAKYKGLIFLPRNHDTCPRITLEARLLDCQLLINDYVQHAHEQWWIGGSIADTDTYLRERPEYFWKTIDETCSKEQPADKQIS